MLTFLTLGPSGSNHAFVLQRYLRAHGLEGRIRVELIDDFHDGARAIIGRQADFLMQCAAHPATPDITGTYRRELSVIDAFVSPSQPMALVRRRVASCRADGVGIQPATRRYVDLCRWQTVVEEPTVLAVHDGLLAGCYDAGIALASFGDAHPRDFEVVQDIGTVCDAWIVYGRDAIDGGQAVVWPNSPAARLFRAG